MSETTDFKASRPRKSVVPPAVVTPDMSLYDYLRKCQPPVDKKIMDIACAQSQVPQELRADASQEIALVWSTMKPDLERFKPGQIAAYAHRVAGHAALRLRRDLGSAVRLPGSAFRKRKDGSSYVTPGVLSAALDWSELESWFLAESGPSGAGNAQGEHASMLSAYPFEESSDSEPCEEQTHKERLLFLESRKDQMTARQLRIIESLLDGASYEDVMLEHNIKRGVLMREISAASVSLTPDFL